MQRVSQDVRETAVLRVLSGADVPFLHTVVQPHAVRVLADVRMASRKVVLAAAEVAERLGGAERRGHSPSAT
jgi:hypothetical protein